MFKPVCCHDYLLSHGCLSSSKYFSIWRWTKNKNIRLAISSMHCYLPAKWIHHLTWSIPPAIPDLLGLCIFFKDTCLALSLRSFHVVDVTVDNRQSRTMVTSAVQHKQHSPSHFHWYKQRLPFDGSVTHSSLQVEWLYSDNIENNKTTIRRKRFLCSSAKKHLHRHSSRLQSLYIASNIYARSMLAYSTMTTILLYSYTGMYVSPHSTPSAPQQLSLIMA